MGEIVQALEEINSAYEDHRQAARALAREYFGHDVVLPRLLADLGLPSFAGGRRRGNEARPSGETTNDEPARQARQEPTEESAGNPSPQIPITDATARQPTTLSEARRKTRIDHKGLHEDFRQLPQCSVIIPVYNRASLTRQCLDALLEGQPENVDFEIVVVDDASIDTTQQLLADYHGRIRVVTHKTNTGFAAACNDGAAAASGHHLVFLNNDVMPNTGWLDALVRYAESQPDAAVVGSKLLFPNDTIQHAGTVVCQDHHPRHIYAGFPAHHPAVNKSRRFQLVSAACMLVRREPFEHMGGFDPAFRNGFEDVDLCLRLGERGYEVHYCHESVLYHLESVSEGRFRNEKDNLRLYLRRWAHRLQPDDLRYYLEDGLVNLSYAQSYPAHLTVSPLLATVDSEEHKRQADRLLNVRSRQVFELLKETIRLTLSVGEAKLPATAEEQTELRHRIRELTEKKDADRHEVTAPRLTVGEQADPLEALVAGTETMPGHEAELRAMLLEAHEQLLQRDREFESIIYDLQTVLVAELRQSVPDTRVAAPAIDQGFAPSKYLDYQQLVRRVREVAHVTLPPKATVAVVSKGDEELLELGNDRRGWHFPQNQEGVYAGYHPADGAEAIAHLEELRAKGAEFLLLPETSFWWLERYGEFGQHLKSRYRKTLYQEDTCIIFALREPETERCDTVAQGSMRTVAGKDALA